jgi:hypothetical protein
VYHQYPSSCIYRYACFPSSSSISISSPSSSKRTNAHFAPSSCSYGLCKTLKVLHPVSLSQWRDDGAYADEQWARLEPLDGARFRVTPEHRDGSLGAPFEVDVREFQDEDGEESDDEGARARL